MDKSFLVNLYIIRIWKIVQNMPTAKTFTNLDYRITKDEIKTYMSKLKSGKVVGMDRILAEMIKTSID